MGKPLHLKHDWTVSRSRRQRRPPSTELIRRRYRLQRLPALMIGDFYPQDGSMEGEGTTRVTNALNRIANSYQVFVKSLESKTWTLWVLPSDNGYELHNRLWLKTGRYFSVLNRLDGRILEGNRSLQSQGIGADFTLYEGGRLRGGAPPSAASTSTTARLLPGDPWHPSHTMTSGAELVQAEVTSVFTPIGGGNSEPVYRVSAKVTEKVCSKVPMEGTHVAVYGRADATMKILDRQQAIQTGRGWTTDETEGEFEPSYVQWGGWYKPTPKVCAHATVTVTGNWNHSQGRGCASFARYHLVHRRRWHTGR